jgi:hypothetical protein
MSPATAASTAATAATAAALTAAAIASAATAAMSSAAMGALVSWATAAVRMPMARLGRRERNQRVVIKARDRNLAADERLDFGQRDRIRLAAEADRIPSGACARRASDPVHVIFRILRQVVVENVAHARNM